MKIRDGIFETNSSSTHSIVISDKCKLYDTLPVYPDGTVVIGFGEFGWEVADYNDADTKARYAATLVKNYFPEHEKMFVDVIKKHTGAKEVLFVEGRDHAKGYIDHQSIEGGSVRRPAVQDVILKNKKSLKNFIFNPNSVLHTDNDNRM